MSAVMEQIALSAQAMREQVPEQVAQIGFCYTDDGGRHSWTAECLALPLSGGNRFLAEGNQVTTMYAVTIDASALDSVRPSSGDLVSLSFDGDDPVQFVVRADQYLASGALFLQVEKHFA